MTKVRVYIYPPRCIAHPGKVVLLLLLYIFGCYDAFVEPMNYGTLVIYIYSNECGIDMSDVRLELH